MRNMISFLQDDRWPAWAQVRHPLAWLAAILLAAVVLRIYGINNISPPGLEHDEVANWLIDQAILNGKLAVYFTEAYGHEAGFHYMQALSVALLGDHALALRLPAAFSGILLVAVHYALTRRLFGTTTALISAAVLAILFWPVFYSRLGLRAITLPLISGLSLYAWWKAWPTGRQLPAARSALWFGLAGVLAGLSLYTYMAARAVPIFFALFVLYLVLFQRGEFKSQWRGVVLFWGMFALFALPLVLFLGNNPGAEIRISEVDVPLRAFLAGNPQPVWLNLLRIGGMFGFAGDPLWRQNVAGRPVFGPLLALFFYGGVLLAILRLKDARYAFLLIWLATSALPSLATIDAPSSIRMINALLIVTIFPVLVMNTFAKLSTLLPAFSTKLAYLLGLLLIVTHIWWTVGNVFHRWPQNAEVQFVWQAALTDMAGYLDDSIEDSPAAIGGWSPATMDAPTMYLSMQRRDLATRFFGSDSMSEAVTTVIIPAWGDAIRTGAAAEGSGARLLRPVARELSPGLEAQLVQWGGEPQNMGTFVVYSLSAPGGIQQLVMTGESFDDQIELVAYKFPDDPLQCRGDQCTVLTYWRILAATDEPRRFFLHVLDGDDLIAQHDGLDAPAQWWQMGDLLVQEHLLPALNGKEVELRLGVYNPESGQRLLLADGADSYRLQRPSTQP